jgi:hypothetical protein
MDRKGNHSSVTAFIFIKGEFEMRRNLITLVVVALSLVVFIKPALAQGPSSNSKTSSRMLYHNGPVRTGIQNVYFIFYGCWGNPACGPGSDPTTMLIPEIFVVEIGNTPYIGINNTYTNGSGQPASASLIYAGNVIDNSYRHGNDLTKSDIEAIISDHISDPGQADLPADTQGIYVIIATADISSNATGFCSPGAPPFHSYYDPFRSAYIPYIFLGNPNRCRTIAGAPFFSPGGTGLLTPNSNFAGDAIVLNLAHALNGLLTDPYDTGWYDRYGLENADKCSGTLGQTFTSANGASANFRNGGYDFLIEQNWVNGRKGYCSMSYSP